jgi:hypothetical protein
MREFFLSPQRTNAADRIVAGTAHSYSGQFSLRRRNFIDRERQYSRAKRYNHTEQTGSIIRLHSAAYTKTELFASTTFT